MTQLISLRPINNPTAAPASAAASAPRSTNPSAAAEMTSEGTSDFPTALAAAQGDTFARSSAAEESDDAADDASEEPTGEAEDQTSTIMLLAAVAPQAAFVVPTIASLLSSSPATIATTITNAVEAERPTATASTAAVLAAESKDVEAVSASAGENAPGLFSLSGAMTGAATALAATTLLAAKVTAQQLATNKSDELKNNASFTLNQQSAHAGNAQSVETDESTMLVNAAAAADNPLITHSIAGRLSVGGLQASPATEFSFVGNTPQGMGNGAASQSAISKTEVDAVYREAVNRSAAAIAGSSALLIEAESRTRVPLTVSSIKPLLAEQMAGDLSNGEELPPTDAASSEVLPAGAFASSALQFATAANPLSGAGNAGEVVGQTVSSLLTAAETVAPRETRTLSFSLHPENLGQIEVQITRDAAGRVSAHLATEHDFARYALTDGISQLRETMERAGLSVDRLDVRATSLDLNASSTAHANHNRESGQPGTSADPTARSLSALPEGAPTDDTAAATRTAHDQRLLNLRA